MRLGLGHGLDVGYRSELFGATSYLLDTYTSAAAAYSLRQLRTGVTSVVRVRRSSDDAEADFTAAEVTDGTLTTWTGANDGFVVTWYDQSGNGYNATQATAANQPKLVNAGALITQDGFAAVSFDGSNDTLNYSTRPAQTAFSAFTVAKCNASASEILVLQTPNGVGDFTIRNNAGIVRTNTIMGDGELVSFTSNTTALRLRSLLYDGTTTTLEAETVANGTIESYLNGSLEDNSAVDTGLSFSGSGIFLGSLGTTLYSSVLISEAILYGSDKSADRADIEAAINSHYSIY